VEDGAPWSAIAERHGKLEATRRADLEAEPLGRDAGATRWSMLHPAPGLWRQFIESCRPPLDHPEDVDGREGREAVRALIDHVRSRRRPATAEYDLEIVGDLAPLLQLAKRKRPPCGRLDGSTYACNGCGERVSLADIT
jgi:hypothetical protein